METKLSKLTITTYIFLSLSLVSCITYLIYILINTSNFIEQILSIISVITLAIFSTLFVIMGLFIDNKKAKIFLIILSSILTIYSLSNIIIKEVNKDTAIDYINKNINEIVTWANKNEIRLNISYEYNENIEKNIILNQSTKSLKQIKKDKSLRISVSNGPNPKTNTKLDNLIGLKLDDVVKYVEDNHLTNVTINFIFSETTPKDIIIDQSKLTEIKRDQEVIITSSLGKENELPSVKLKSLIGLDEFHTKVYLGRNNIKYKINYEYNENVEDGYVFKQSIPKWTVIDPSENKEIIINISKKDIITVPNLSKLNISEITTWATNNHIELEYVEEYDDTIKKGNVISSNYSEGTNIKPENILKITVSKGQIKMIKYDNIDDFKEWAKENNIEYHIDYEYSNNIEVGKLITSSHKENELIKNNDIIKLVISQGGNTKIPNLLNLSKEKALEECKKKNINCKFINDGNTVIKQSMKENSTVPINTTITLTLED